MPLTARGRKIKRAMTKQYGEKKGESVFYASKNKGTISGVDGKRFRSAVRDAIAKRMSVRDALAAGVAKSKPTMDAARFRRTMRDAARRGISARDALRAAFDAEPVQLEHYSTVTAAPAASAATPAPAYQAKTLEPAASAASAAPAYQPKTLDRRRNKR